MHLHHFAAALLFAVNAAVLGLVNRHVVEPYMVSLTALFLINPVLHRSIELSHTAELLSQDSKASSAGVPRVVEHLTASVRMATTSPLLTQDA